jgi:hypothetical protein
MGSIRRKSTRELYTGAGCINYNFKFLPSSKTKSDLCACEEYIKHEKSIKNLAKLG